MLYLIELHTVNKVKIIRYFLPHFYSFVFKLSGKKYLESLLKIVDV